MDDDWVLVKPGLRFPRVIVATGGAWGEDGYSAALTARWDGARLAYEVDEITLTAGDGHPVSAAGLRRFSLVDLLRSVVEGSVEDARPTPEEDLASIGRLRPDDPIGLGMAARVYAVARAHGAPPLKAVADAFGVSQSTATRVIARARESGLLD